MNALITALGGRTCRVITAKFSARTALHTYFLRVLFQTVCRFCTLVTFRSVATLHTFTPVRTPIMSEIAMNAACSLIGSICRSTLNIQESRNKQSEFKVCHKVPPSKIKFGLLIVKAAELLRAAATFASIRAAAMSPPVM